MTVPLVLLPAVALALASLVLLGWQCSRDAARRRASRVHDPANQASRTPRKPAA